MKKAESIIIIGAGRSGTNMLRDVLCRIPGICTWPCDEINPIWRHGNTWYPSDEFKVEMARPSVTKFINQCFDRIKKRYGMKTVVEKTCANSLRVGFVDRVIPDAKFVFIRRNGIDVTASALKRWTAKVDLYYQLKKARFVPLSDIPYYGFKFLKGRLHRLCSADKRLATWGPQFNNLSELLENHSLVEVCAIQWKQCVELSLEQFTLISSERIIEIKYEDFVKNPKGELKRILEFLNYSYIERDIINAIADVSAKSIGKGILTLGKEKIERILPHISETQQKIGY